MIGPSEAVAAVVLGALASEAKPANLRDPNVDLEARFVALVEMLAARELEDDAPKTVGLVYPTEFTEDLSLVRLYKRWFEARGRDVVLGSPYNLATDERGTLLFDTPVGIVLRHYKTDWWGERQSVWDDDEVQDTEPLASSKPVASPALESSSSLGAKSGPSGSSCCTSESLASSSDGRSSSKLGSVGRSSSNSTSVSSSSGAKASSSFVIPSASPSSSSRGRSSSSEGEGSGLLGTAGSRPMPGGAARIKS